MKTHAGKLLRIDLTNRKTEVIPTSKYEKWMGGVGIATALFWDEVNKDYITDTWRITGFEPENVISIAAGAMCGTMYPGNSQVDVCGIAPETYPRPQFIRSGIGNYIGPMMKYAGYDGLVIKGKADSPVWVDIRDADVKIRNAKNLWGKGFFQTQREIWNEIEKSPAPNGRTWFEAATMQPAILGIGPAGENLCRVACLAHGTNSAAGFGGFGGVFGSKNLKAISIVGTGAIEIAHPVELMDTWLWMRKYAPRKQAIMFAPQPSRNARSLACFGCTTACRGTNTTETEMPGAGGKCAAMFLYTPEVLSREGKLTSARHIASQTAHDYGINAIDVWVQLMWLESLYERGLLGEGKRINTSLDFTRLGAAEFIQDLFKRIAYRVEIGDDLAEGQVRAAAKWGVLEEDLGTGIISAIHWGLGEQHWTNNMSWAYGSLFDSRDFMAHDHWWFSDLKNLPKRFAEMAPPWHDEFMLDQSEEGVYSIHMARRTCWTQRLGNLKSFLPWCERLPFDTFNKKTPDGKGISPEMEERFCHAIIGGKITWADLLEIGRKIQQFKRAILVLNGRHRKEEYFPPYPPYTSYVYTEGPPTLQYGNLVMKTELVGMLQMMMGLPVKRTTKFRNFDLKSMTDTLEKDTLNGGHWQLKYPVYVNGEWVWSSQVFPLKKDRMDEFKSMFYELEGWDPKTGWPTRSTLEGCGLGYVADVIEKQGKSLKP